MAQQHPVFLWYPPLPTPFLDDDLPTHTSREQKETERRVKESQQYVLPRQQQSKNKYKKKMRRGGNTFGGEAEDNSDDDENDAEADVIPLLTSCPALCELSFGSHAAYLLAGLLGSGCHSSLDASRPWLVYWVLHGLDVLDRLEEQVSPELARATLAFLARCIHKDGGVGGGPGQQPHTAPTYASVLSLCILSSHPACGTEAIALLQSARKGIYAFFMRCKVIGAGAASGSGAAPGGFRVSRDGEVDTRGSYTVLAVASLLGLLTPELTSGVGAWLGQCQTYEGGLGGEPGNEAHGGYTFCGLAASVLMGDTSHINLKTLLKWAANRQMEREGGFQGRTNKLVDGCYSFWVGALFPLLHSLLQQGNGAAASAAAAAPAASSSSSSSSSAASPSPASPLPDSLASDPGWLFDTVALQRYVLVSCQMAMGGLRDKPGKYADLYHTCYCLSGLSVAQNATSMHNSPILGKQENVLVAVHPLYNLRYAHVERIMPLFAQEASPQEQ